MFTISETQFAKLHTLTFKELTLLMDSFTKAFPYMVDILVHKDDIGRMVSEAREIAGEEHPEITDIYSSAKFKWSEYHPKTADIVTRYGMMVSSKVGFARSADAIQFKLKWYQN